MKCICLDVGEKTVGIAVSDDMGWTAQGVTTINRRSLSQDLDHILKIVDEYGVDRLIYGLPLNMNGSEGPQSLKVRTFVQALEKKLGDRTISLIAWDERLSTCAAERSLLEADLSRAKRRKVINKMAAVFILQGYLDSISLTEPQYTE